MRPVSRDTIPPNATVIDIRDDLERSQHPFEVAGLNSLKMLPISLTELEDGDPELPNTPLVVVCSRGRRSEYAAALLEALGAKEVYVLDGGISR